MKKLVLFVVIAVVALSMVANVNAKNRYNQQWLLNRAEENYVMLCNQGYESVMESVIFNVIMMKNNYPDFNYDKIINALDKLAKDHESVTVQHKAYIASVYLRHSELFKLPATINKQNPNACFKAMALDLENAVFVEK